MEVSEEFRRRVRGYGLTLAEIWYTKPGKPWLVNGFEYVWQFEDIAPDFPRLTTFLNERWPQEIPDSRPVFVRISHNNLLRPIQLGAMDGVFRIH